MEAPPLLLVLNSLHRMPVSEGMPLEAPPVLIERRNLLMADRGTSSLTEYLHLSPSGFVFFTCGPTGVFSYSFSA